MVKNKSYAEETENQDVNGEMSDAGQKVAGGSNDSSDANMSDNGAAGNDKAADVAGANIEAMEWKDKYFRLSAEFDNFRKRTLKEKMDIAASGGQEVIKAILPVLDDMDRALEAMHKTEDVEAVRSGVELISHKLLEMLKAKGLSEIEAMGQKLDTDFHEAVAKFAAEEGKKGLVIDVMQKGYMLKDKVLRHSKVVVGD